MGHLKAVGAGSCWDMSILGHCEVEEEWRMGEGARFSKSLVTFNGASRASVLLEKTGLNLRRDKGMNHLHFHKKGSIACR